jgi:hypothetical protein
VSSLQIRRPIVEESPLPWGEGVSLRRSHQPERDG